MHTLASNPSVDAETFLTRAERRWKLTYAAAGMGTLFLLGLTLFAGHVGFPVAASVYTLGLVAILLRPVIGIYLVAFLGLLADDVSAPYWPFLKNGSSEESLLYLSDSLVVSPMEGYLVAIALSLGLHIVLRRLTLTKPPLLIPLSAFMFFICVGFVWGVGRGGDLTIALWEFRPFAALFLVYMTASTLIETRRQVHILSWFIIAALSIEGLRTVVWYVRTPDSALFNSPIEHSGASHLNLLFVIVILAWLIRGSGFAHRLLIPLLSVPAIFIYLASERRSAIAALLMCLTVVFVFIAAVDMRRCLQVGPLLAVLLVMYTAVFWNASGVLGFPAGVIKSQIAPETQSLEDQSSDAYRIIEHLDILATIQNSPILGVGFGQKYEQPIPLPDISAGFIWWEYMTHNGILWIWLKAGYFGFIAMFNFLGRGLHLGMRTAISARDPNDRVIAGASMVFIPIYGIFSYVDISWGTQSLILLALCLVMIGRLHQVVESESAPETA